MPQRHDDGSVGDADYGTIGRGYASIFHHRIDTL